MCCIILPPPASDDANNTRVVQHDIGVIRTLRRRVETWTTVTVMFVIAMLLVPESVMSDPGSEGRFNRHTNSTSGQNNRRLRAGRATATMHQQPRSAINNRTTHEVISIGIPSIRASARATSARVAPVRTASAREASARTASAGPSWCPAPESCAPDLAHKLASNHPAKSAIDAADAALQTTETIVSGLIAISVENPLAGAAVGVIFGLISAFEPETDSSCDKTCIWDSIGSVVKEVVGEAVDASEISNRYSKLDGVIQEINNQYAVANLLKQQYPDNDFCCVATGGDHCKNPLPTTQSSEQVASPNQMWCNVATALNTIRQGLVDDEMYYKSVPKPNGINSLVQYFSTRIVLEVSMFLFSDPMFVPTASCVKFASSYDIPSELSVEMYCDTNEGWRDYMMFGLIDPSAEYIRTAVATAKTDRMAKIKTLAPSASKCAGAAINYNCRSTKQRAHVIDNGCGASGTGTWDMIVPRGTCDGSCYLDCDYADFCMFFDDDSDVANRATQDASACQSAHETYVRQQQLDAWNTLALDTVEGWGALRSSMSQWGPWVTCTAVGADYCDGRYITCTPPVMHDSQFQSTGISCDPAAQPNELCYPGNGLPCCDTQTVPSYVAYHQNYQTGAWMC